MVHESSHQIASTLLVHHCHDMSTAGIGLASAITCCYHMPVSDASIIRLLALHEHELSSKNILIANLPTQLKWQVGRSRISMLYLVCAHARDSLHGFASWSFTTCLSSRKVGLHCSAGVSSSARMHALCHCSETCSFPVTSLRRTFSSESQPSHF